MAGRFLFFLVSIAAAVTMIAALPEVVAYEDDFADEFWISSLVTFVLAAYAVGATGSIISAEALISTIWFLRFLFPAIAFNEQAELSSALFLVNMTEKTDFHIAAVATNAGAVAVLGGIHLIAGGRARSMDAPLGKAEHSALALSSLCFFVLGVLAMIAFVFLNTGSFTQAFLSGEIRRTDIVEGSGDLFYLGYAMIPAAVTYGWLQLRRHGRVTLLSLAIVLIAFVILAVLGGRVRALVPVMGFILCYLTVKRMDRITPASIFIILAGYCVAMAYLAFGSMYRGEGLDAALALSVRDIVQYVEWSMVSEMGQLHGALVPLRSGEGMLGGRTYLELTWPLPEFVDLQIRNTGVLVRELATGPMFDATWGFHATMIGDAILNFGRWWIIPHCVVFGAVLGGLRRIPIGGSIATPLAALGTLGLVRAFSEGTSKVPEIYVYFGFGFAILIAASVLLRLGLFARPDAPPVYRFARRPRAPRSS